MIRFGLLGCGRIAKRHSELLGGGRIDRAGLVAVCDPIRPRADAIASKFGVGTHYDIDDFLARKDIDAVAVLTPSGMHRLCQGWEACRRRNADGVAAPGRRRAHCGPTGKRKSPRDIVAAIVH